jgi:hypothetical protein
LIGNNTFTIQFFFFFLSATMSNLVIPLPILIHSWIINKHDSMPFVFKIIKVATPNYSISTILLRLQTYQTSFFNGGITLLYLQSNKTLPFIENCYIYFKHDFKSKKMRRNSH